MDGNLMLWFAPNDAWDRPHEPIHIVNAFYDGPIGKLKEKCLVGIMKFIHTRPLKSPDFI